MEQEPKLVKINFIAFWLTLKREKWIIMGIIFFFTIAGFFYSFSLKEEFKTEGKLLPEIQSKSGSIGQFAGLAALAGVDLSSVSSGADAIRPDLYPDVLKSTSFFLRLFQEKIKDKNNNELSFQDYYFKEILNGKLNKEDQILRFPISSNYIALNRQTERNIINLKTRIICTYDKKSGVISIAVKMPDPVVAANVTHFSMNYLTDYIIAYRTEKEKRDLDFLENQLAAAKGKYYNIQSKKATYTDQMPSSALRMKSADLQRERIEADYKISSSFYNTLLQKYEEAKLKMQQETPVIKILEMPLVPNLKSEPKKSIIILGAMVMGAVVALIVSLLIRKNYKLIFA
ncbi:Wzz/FepE/Etk N-terminal domain-containing protein [Lacihabitans sp. CS3-21]|uniref:Wzz/FepE/Etk N-terminal domain-containing protein n=1 Tax=Lacihabitans sp. CS3-21 TaxID=2487332 RepID=UPI0020CC9DDE|nr:Wzz/FepE/Etk N-terminal domain-containing protein [Lacihabitans sp. CS3-21]MCP9747571.1 lipopolysaccharide biosynthesis protein [Lacihabitans sp. CS3-21]